MRSLLLALAVPVLCFAQAQAQPRLVLETEHHDFGQVPTGTTVATRFKVRNGGDAPLRGLRAVASCGCSSSVAGKDQLAPGESTEILVTFNSLGFLGPVHKSVTVQADDPAGPPGTFTFEADVVQPVAASETRVWFNDLARTDRRKHSVRLHSLTGKPISVDNVALSQAPWLGVATRPDGADQWVDLDLVARDLPKDRFAGVDTVDLYLNNPLSSTLHLEVHWQLRSPVRFSPARVAWSANAGQEQRADVVLEALDQRPVGILSVRTSTPLLRVAPLGRQPAPRQTLHLALDAGAPAGTHLERVFLTLDRPGHPEVELRVDAVLR